MIGRTINQYKILEKLGAGGMGVVYKAEDTQLKRLVALKFLPPPLAASEEGKSRFLREARAAAASNHPNICTVYELGEADGQPFIAMAYISGPELTVEIERGPFEIGRVINTAIQVAEGLREAHNNGVVHRDIKPSNIMLSSSGAAVVMDFGLAQLNSAASRLTQDGMTVGTAAYMSPEQTTAEEVDHRTDIWSFGVVLYEMATGEFPFKGQYRQAIQYAILAESPESLTALCPEAPPALERVLEKCLAKRPADRYQSFDDLLSDLRSVKKQVDSGVVSAEALRAAAPRPRRALVGRKTELAKLRKLLESAHRGAGSLVLIGGEPGVGKTRLCEEVLADAAASGTIVLTGHSYESEGAQSFIPFIESLESASRNIPQANLRAALGDVAPELAKLAPELRRIFADIPEPEKLRAEQQQRSLFNGFREFIQRLSHQAPVVWLLDDLHWAEESSLLLLQHLTQSLDEIPVLLLGTYRDVELEVGKPFAKTLSLLVRQRLAQRMTLRRLTQSSVADLLGSLGGERPPDPLLRAIYHETEGNPFFVEEVFQHLSEEGKLFDADGRWKSDFNIEDLDVPEGVRLVIGRRLERLSSGTPKILSAAAVIGRVFDLGTLEAMEGFDPDGVLDAIEEAESANLIEPVSSGRAVSYRFTHELIRHTVLQGISIRRRQRIHLRIAQVLERMNPGNVSGIAHHLFEAGASADLEKTVRYLKLAGEREMGTGAFQEALDHFDDALGLAQEESPEIRADLLYLKGRAEYTLGNTKQALAAWRAAARLYEELGDAAGVAQTCGEILFPTCWSAEFEDTIEVFRRALATTREDVSPERCRILATAGAGIATTGDCDSTPQLLEEAVKMAEAFGDSTLLGEVVYSKIISNWLFMTGEQWVKDSQGAFELLDAARNPWCSVEAAGLLRVGLVFAGRVKEAVAPSDTEKAAERIGHIGALAGFRIGRDFGKFIQSGDIDELERFAQWYRDWNQNLDYPWDLVAYSHLGLCRFFRGDWEDFHQDFQRGIEIEERRPSGWYAWGNYFMAMAYAGDERAMDLLERKRDLLPRERPFNICGAWVALMRVIEGLAVMGRREEAAELYPLARLSTETGTVVEFFSTTMPQLSAGIAAACARDWDAAEEHYGTALTQAREMPHRIAEADIRRWYAQMLLDRDQPGDRSKGGELLSEAIERYRELGMPKHLAMAQRLRAPL